MTVVDGTGLISAVQLRSRPRHVVERRIGVGLLAVIALVVIAVPLLWPYGPNELVATPFEAPSAAHPFGTDSLGRDIFVRTFAGGRVDLVAAGLTTIFALLVGTLLGTWAGMTNSRLLDATIMRIADAVRGFPMIIFLLVVVMVIGAEVAWGPAPAGLIPVMIALMTVQWSTYARLARGQTLSVKAMEYVEAARVAGIKERHILLRHIVPSVGRITGAFAVGDAVLVVVILASLPFIGIGVQPPAAEWGSIMYEGRAFVSTAWWITILPGAVLAVTGLGLALVADSFLEVRR